MARRKPKVSELSKELGAVFRKLRIARDMVLEDAADALDTYAGNLSRKERGLESLTSSDIERLCALYGITGSQLYANLEIDPLGGNSVIADILSSLPELDDSSLDALQKFTQHLKAAG